MSENEVHESEVSEAETPPQTEQEWEDFGHHLEAHIRETIGGWVGAGPDDDWQTVGRLMEANFRGRMAEMVGAAPGEEQEKVTWDDIGAKVDNRMRQIVGGWAGAEPEDDWATVGQKTDAKIRAAMSKAVRAEPAEEGQAATWDEIGSRIEANIRQGIGGWVGAEPDAGWETIGDRIGEELRRIFGRAKEETPPPRRRRRCQSAGVRRRRSRASLEPIPYLLAKALDWQDRASAQDHSRGSQTIWQRVSFWHRTVHRRSRDGAPV